jgi:DNA invertase Pin-like site-specific DNA recombinase
MNATYLRVSSDKQDVARQRQSIKHWADTHGYQISHWFEDSEGRNPRDLAARRPQFQKLLRAVESGMVKRIIVDSQDRFGTRDAYEFGKFLTFLRDYNCELWSVSQGELTKDDDATILTNTIGALTSTREQKEKAARNVGGKIVKAKAGEYQGGYPGYGLDVVCFNGHEKWRVEWVGHFERWKIYPDGNREAFNGKDNFPAKDANDTLRYRPGNSERLEVVRNIFHWYATEDVSPGQIATRLNKLGITTTVGDIWNKQIVRQLLLNPVYIGLPAWNKRGGSRFKEWVGGKIQDVTGKAGRTRQPEDYVQPEKPEFEPIIDLETWYAVQAKIVANKQGKKRSPQVSGLWLKGFLVCGKCNKPMHACGPQPRMEYGSYICGTYGTYGKDNPTGCRCHRVKHSILEALVQQYLEEVAPKIAALVECEDSGLFDVTYRAWAKSVHEKNKLWCRMADTVTEWGEDWWNIEKYYQPSDCPELHAEIEAKEAELEEMLAGFFKLPPKVQDRASRKMEAIQEEIDNLKAEIENLTAPWLDASREVYERSKAMEHALSVAEEDGPRRAEALRKVVDRIVCHFRYSAKKSFLDSVEIYPVSGEVFHLSLADSSFGNGIKPGPN